MFMMMMRDEAQQTADLEPQKQSPAQTRGANGGRGGSSGGMGGWTVALIIPTRPIRSKFKIARVRGGPALLGALAPHSTLPRVPTG